MKKKFIVTAAIAALMGVGAYFGHATVTPDNASDLLLANAEALADPEWWIEINWADGCEAGTDICVRGPQEVHYNAKDYFNPPAN